MARSYAMTGALTTPNSSTAPVAELASSTSIRPKIFDLLLSSSSTPADNVAQLKLQRATSIGSGGVTCNSYPIDAGDPAQLATSLIGPWATTQPTLEANKFVLQVAFNQRATVRWVAAPGKELVIPATANYGLCLMNPSRNSDFSLEFTIYFEE